MTMLMLLMLLFLLGSSQLTKGLDPASYFGGGDNEAYVAWLQTETYSKSAFLASTLNEGMGVALHWSSDDAVIRLAVAAKATGWAAFGLGETGSMRGADIVMFTAGTNELVDSYVLDQLVKPLPDDCQSWTLVNSTAEGGFIIFEATRLLDTGDTQDRIFIDDSNVLVPPTRVIAAWGDSSGPYFHGTNTARGVIRFFGNTSITDEYEAFARVVQEEAEGSFTIQANDFLIPAKRTLYQPFCLSRDDILAMNVTLDQDLHTIAMEPIIDPRSKPYIHHYILTASAEAWNSSLDCKRDFPGFEVAYAWAPGDVPQSLPSNVGGPLGGTYGFQSFKLEIHYNNPKLDENVLDSSGVRIYYTSKKREFDSGILQLGDPLVKLSGGLVSENGGLAQHNFTCGSRCSATFFTEPVTVIRENLHMHATGVSMVNTQIRDSEDIRQGQVEYWDFAQQGNVAVAQPPFVINPGDSFRTVCNYNSYNETWGTGSEDEMCIAFLLYYPRQHVFGVLPYTCAVGIAEYLPACEAYHDVTPNFTDLVQLQRSFGRALTTCPNTPSPTPPNSAPSGQDSSGNAGTSSLTPPNSSPRCQDSAGNNGTSSSPAMYPTSFIPSGLIIGAVAIAFW